MRDYQVYLDKAKERGAVIKYIFETHFHADFVSGHIDLAKATGAPIIYGPSAKTGFDIIEAKDGQKFALGKLNIEVLHTPGHTPESSCFLLYDEQGNANSIFTGDTLFVGDVGRPDLLDGLMSKEELAGLMYQSLNGKLKKLPDDVIVYPAHGAGSSCGKNLGPERHSTIGEQKRSNYAMQDMGVEEFIKQVTDGMQPPPAYFFSDAKLNKQGYLALDTLIEKANQSLSLPLFEKAVEEGAVIIDTRKPDDFEMGFIPGAINIGLNGQYAIWAATLLDLKQPLVIVAAEGTEEESIIRLARVGFENIQGYLLGGFEDWRKADKPLDMVVSIDADEFALDVKHTPQMQMLDVRKLSEWEAGHVKGSRFFPLQDLPEAFKSLNKEEDYYVYCGGGYRSMVAISLLKKTRLPSV